MSAAEKIEQPQHQIQYLDLKVIYESKLNTRQTFTGMDELQASIAQYGVRQPILVRPLPAANGTGVERYEIIYGARRFRAAKGAQLANIPAIVEAHTDVEAIELGILENCQRQDVPFLEEAEGYKALQDHGLTAEAIAEKVGKSRAHVYARIELTKLTAKARAIVEKHNLGSERALLLARIPDPARQLEAAERIAVKNTDWQTHESTPMGVREATRFVRENYMLELAGAPFNTKDPDLMKEAGPCTTCPFRTKNKPDLFDDIGKGDLCTKPSCFNEKRAASWARERKQAKDAGFKVLTEAEASKTFAGHAGRVQDYADYVRTKDECALDPKRRTWGQLMGKEAPRPTAVGRDQEGKVVQLIPKAEALQVLEDRGHKFAKEAKAHGTPTSHQERWEKEREASKRAAAEEMKLAHRLIARLVEKVEARQPDKKFWRTIVESVESDYGINEDVCTRRGWDAEAKGIGPYLDKMSEDQLRGLAFELTMERDLYSHYSGVNRKKICEAFGVDVAKERTALKDEEREAKKKADAEAKAKDKEQKAAEKAGAKKAKKEEAARTVAPEKPGKCAICGKPKPNGGGVCAPCNKVIDAREAKEKRKKQKEERQAAAKEATVFDMDACRVCGCTEDRACVESERGPCCWLEDDLCNYCGEALDQLAVKMGYGKDRHDIPKSCVSAAEKSVRDAKRSEAGFADFGGKRAAAGTKLTATGTERKFDLDEIQDDPEDPAKKKAKA